MQTLNPTIIFNQYKNKEIDKISATNYLKIIIENGKDEIIIVEALKFFIRIEHNSEINFKLLEQLLVSDSSESIRSASATIIIKDFLEKGEALIKWTFNNENSMTCLLKAYECLKTINNKESIELINFLQITLDSRFSNLDFYEREQMGLGYLERRMGKIQPYLLDMTLFHELDFKKTEDMVDEIEKLLEDPSLRHVDYANLMKNLGDIYLEPEQNEDDIKEKELSLLFRVSSLGLKVDPKNTGLIFNLGCAYEQKGDIENAIEAFELVINVKDENDNPSKTHRLKLNAWRHIIPLYNSKAQKFKDQGSYKKSIEIYEYLIDNNIRDRITLHHLSNLYKEINNPLRGIKIFKKIFDSDLKNVNALYELGTFYSEIKDYKKALNAFTKVLKFDSKNLRTLFKIGSIYFIQKKYEKALEIYKRILVVEFREFNVWDFLTFFYNLKQDYDKVREVTKRTLDLYEEFTNPWIQLGYFFYNNGRPHEAVEVAQIQLKNRSINFINYKSDNLKNLTLLYERLSRFKLKI